MAGLYAKFATFKPVWWKFRKPRFRPRDLRKLRAERESLKATDSQFAPPSHVVPFRQWIAEGPKSQLPWRARIFSPELSEHQRISARIQIEVKGNEWLKRCCDGRSVALVEITDLQGRTYGNYAVQDLKEVKPGLSQL